MAFKLAAERPRKARPFPVLPLPFLLTRRLIALDDHPQVQRPLHHGRSLPRDSARSGQAVPGHSGERAASGQRGVSTLPRARVCTVNFLARLSNVLTMCLQDLRCDGRTKPLRRHPFVRAHKNSRTAR